MDNSLTSSLRSKSAVYPTLNTTSLMLSLLFAIIGLFIIISLFVLPVNAVEKAGLFQIDKVADSEVYQICMNVSLDPNFVELSCTKI